MQTASWQLLLRSRAFESGEKCSGWTEKLACADVKYSRALWG